MKGECIWPMYSQLTPYKMHTLKITTRTTTITAILAAAVTLVVGAAVLSTQQIAQAITTEEGIQLLNDVADRLETHSSEGADRIRDVATLVGDHDGGVGCSPWDPRY
jgi:hypothetical protein